MQKLPGNFPSYRLHVSEIVASSGMKAARAARPICDPCVNRGLALNPRARIFRRLLIGTLADRVALQPDRQTRLHSS